jgi:hypothetical protein
MGSEREALTMEGQLWPGAGPAVSLLWSRLLLFHLLPVEFSSMSL